MRDFYLMCNDLRLKLIGSVLTILLLAGCSGGAVSKNGVRIGIDPAWYPLDFGPQTSYINGFTEELLLEVASYNGVDFIRVHANADTLLEGMQNGKYDAVLTSLPPYNFNMAKYDFSKNFLDLGPVLIVPVNAGYAELSQLNGELVGTLTNDPAMMLLQSYPDIIMRHYPTAPDLLNAVVLGEIEGALLDRLPAYNFIRDLYSKQLKIVGRPLNETGLRLIALKGKNTHIIKRFDKAVEEIKKKKKTHLLEKWELGGYPQTTSRFGQ